MKKRLTAIYFRGILITIAMAALAIFVAAKLKVDDTRSHLQALLTAASRWTIDSNEDLQSLADSIAGVSSSLRVTFLLESGLVLADSAGEAESSGNHYQDVEIAAARRGEVGRNMRMSESGTALYLYMARRVSPQLILRLGYPVFEIAGILIGYGSLLILLFLILFSLERKSLSKLADDELRQFEDVRRLLDGETEEVKAVFPEYQPQLDAIAYRIRRLKDDREEIMRTLNLRNDFVANASHELRSPLTSVRGFAEMLHENMAETPEERELCISMILDECDRMLAVIEDILRLSKAEREKAPPETFTEVSKVAGEVCRSLSPQAAKKRIRLETEGEMRVRADERDLWEILYNLTDNAIRYGREDGYVRILMSDMQLTVEDDGIGIAKEHIGSIFEQFYRVDETRDSTAGGTGLGLSIVRAIVQRLGGEIRAESEPGVGTRFIITFTDSMSQRSL